MKKITLLLLIVFTAITVQGQNKLLSSIRQYNSLGSWKNSYANNYEYDSNNNLITETRLNWNTNGAWEVKEKTSYTYNANNKVTEELYKSSWDSPSNTLENSYKATYIYTNGKFTEAIYYEWISSNWVIDGKTLVTYNSNNLPSIVIESYWKNSQWVNEERTTYTYNASNIVISAVFEEWEGGQWVNSEKKVYTYDSKNKLITDRRAIWDDFNAEWKANGDNNEYEWDITGNKTQNINYYRYNGNNYQYKAEYTYETTKLMSGFAHPFKDKTGFDYFEEGGFPYVNKLLSENSFDYNNFTNSFEISASARTTYNYNNAITLSTDSFKNEVATITVYPNPTSDFINIQSEANTAIDKAIVTDMSGKVLQQSQNANKIDVRNLSKGMYLLQLSVGQQQETRKFIKK